jgi:hypothetical protein
MHRRVLQHVNHLQGPLVNHPEYQLANQVEHQLVNRLLYASNQTHRPVNHLLYASSQTHQRVQTVSQAIILNNDRTEHPVTAVVLVEALPEEGVVLAGEVLEGEAAVEDGKTEIQIPGKKDMLPGIFFEPDSRFQTLK